MCSDCQCCDFINEKLLVFQISQLSMPYFQGIFIKFLTLCLGTKKCQKWYAKFTIEKPIAAQYQNEFRKNRTLTWNEQRLSPLRENESSNIKNYGFQVRFKQLHIYIVIPISVIFQVSQMSVLNWHIFKNSITERGLELTIIRQ